MNRIEKTFAQSGDNKSVDKLITFSMAYDGGRNLSRDIFCRLIESGADIIEIGMPFSDPMADGLTIQEAGIRAIAAGASVSGVLGIAKEVREKFADVPIILMGYVNPIYQYGYDKFLQEAKASGIDGIIIVDLPLEEENEFSLLCHRYGISIIHLIAPTTDEERIKKIAKVASGFIYYISVAGITGAKQMNIADVKARVATIRQHCNLPIAVGFGVSNRQQFEEISQFADAVVIGSALVKIIAKNENVLQEVADFVRDIKS
jgi:tryptophan synthase alpha chain